MLSLANSSQKGQDKFNKQLNEARNQWQTQTSQALKETDAKLRKIEKNLLAKLHEFNHANGILEDKVLELRSHFVLVRRDVDHQSMNIKQ